MKKIKLITDSTCDLSEALIQQMNIEVVPLYVSIGDKHYKDGLDLKQNELYDLVATYDALPSTAAPSPSDFHSVFKHYIEQDYDILVICLSSKMSATYQNASIAKEMIVANNIEGDIGIIDSRNLSTGTGLLVMEAYDAIQAGKNLLEIENYLNGLVPHGHSSFTIETFEYLQKGGRCSGLTATVGGMLKIKPIIKVSNGSLIVGGKIRGKKKALDKMIEETMVYKKQLLHSRLFITHTTGSEEEAIYIKNKLTDQIDNLAVYITYAGCVIASHCGKKTIGILFIEGV